MGVPPSGCDNPYSRGTREKTVTGESSRSEVRGFLNFELLVAPFTLVSLLSPAIDERLCHRQANSASTAVRTLPARAPATGSRRRQTNRFQKSRPTTGRERSRARPLHRLPLEESAPTRRSNW